MKASNYKWLTALLLIQARVSVSFPYSTPSTVVQNAKTRLTDQRTTSCLTRRRHSLAYRRSNRSSKTTHVICNESSPSSRTAVIDSYKSLPVVDDGLGPLDFSITDSLSVPDHARPTLVESVSNPREILAIILLILGGCSVAYHNIFGIYGPSYEMAQRISIGLGFSNAFAVILQLQTSFLISKRVRMGIMDDATLTAYAGYYSFAASWLALRTSTFCPGWLAFFDGLLPWVAAAIFAYSLAGPAITLYEHFNNGGFELSKKMVQASRFLTPNADDNQSTIPTELSETELFRTTGLLFIGILGCVFVPACLAFAFQGEEWWHRVNNLHPKQSLLESTDALFAVFATEASMICTRAAKVGVAPFRAAVPTFAGVCLMLALVPCACSLWWLGGTDDISFFSFYTE